MRSQTPAENREREILRTMGEIVHAYYLGEANKYDVFAKLIVQAERSEITHMDGFVEWIEGQNLPLYFDDTKTLPMISSGSFYNAILDTDGIESHFNPEY